MSNPRPQFASLARHLLAAFPVPAFMTSVWFKGRGALGRRQQGWFIHIGSGKSIRTLGLTLPYTKKMAHHFLQAPDHFTVEAALRWGQVRGLGGSRELAYAVAATRLADPVECEEFWVTVIQFLVNHPELDLAHVRPIVEYLHDQRFVLEEHFDLMLDEVTWRVPQPRFSMKGRTPRSLLRDVREWQKSIGTHGKKPGLRWAAARAGTVPARRAGSNGQGTARLDHPRAAYERGAAGGSRCHASLCRQLCDRLFQGHYVHLVDDGRRPAWAAAGLDDRGGSCEGGGRGGEPVL